MDAILPFLVCICLPALGISLVLSLIAMTQLSSLRDRLARMQLDIDTLRGQLARPRPAPVEPPKTTLIAPISTPSAQPHTAPQVVPHAIAATELLRQKIDEVREKHRPEPAPAPTPTQPTRVPAPPANIPASVIPAPAAAIPTIPPAPSHTVPHTPPRPAPPPPAASPIAPARPKPGLEAYIGMKLFVIVGAICLALAGIFLVKLAVDKNYFNPAVRVILGAAAGLALLATAQWRRKREAFIAQGLSAAGIVALFASIFAATTLYHYLSPLAGFFLLACVTAAAVLLSLQKEGGGPLIATLGLIGGFITPLLVRTDAPNVPGLFGYLLLLHVGLIAVTRLRGWTILAALSVIFSSAWLLVWMLWFPWNPADAPILGSFLLATVVSMVVSAVSNPDKWHGNFAATTLTWLAGALGLITSCVLLGKSGFSNLEWGFFAALVAGSFVLGRLRSQYEGLTWLCSAAVLAMLVTWGLTGGLAAEAHGDFVELASLADPGELLRLRWLMIGFGTACTLAAYACQWKSAAPARWATLATALSIAYVLCAYWILGHSPRADAWAWLPLATAAALIALTVPVFLQRVPMRTGESTLAIYAHGILFLLAIAPPMALTHAPLTAAWAALLPLTALAAWRLRLPALLTGFLGIFALVAIRAVFFWSTLEQGAPGTLIWNPIIWTYGSILVAMVLSVLMIERANNAGPVPPALSVWIPDAESISSLLQVAATAAGFLLLTLEVRWYFHDGRLREVSALLTERGTYGVGWLLLACALVWLGHVRSRAVLVRCGSVVGAVGMAYVVSGMVVFTNPLWWGDDPGHLLIVNNLLYVYGLPAALCGCLAHLLRLAAGKDSGAPTLAALAGTVGFLLLFVLSTFEVRHGFLRGPMNLTGITFFEWATYAIVWMVLGLACLGAGMLFRRDLPYRAGTIFTGLGAAFAIVVCGILDTPLRNHESVGTLLILNHLLYAYGIPLALCLVAAWLVGARQDAATAPGLGWAFSFYVPARMQNPLAEITRQFQSIMRLSAIVLAWILVTMDVRQGFQGQFLDEWQMNFVERGTYPIAWLILAAPLLWIGRRYIDLTARRAGLAIASLALVFVSIINSLVMNPLWDHQSVGSLPVLNWLLYVFGLPALGAGLLARALWQREDVERTLAYAAALVGLALTFILVSLQVRQVFHGEFLDVGIVSHGEMAAYSMAWALLGGIFLVAGILRQSAMMRWASLVLMLLTVIKVFIVDMADLKDMLRVLSFAGLGVSLMALAFIYQHFVFRKPTAVPVPAEPLPPADAVSPPPPA